MATTLSSSMIDLISKGGPLMWLLLACSFLSLGIFAERFFLFHRATINVGDFLQGLANLIGKKNYAEALLSARPDFTVSNWETTQNCIDPNRLEADRKSLIAAGLP